jgi:hypothetical protein
MAGRASGHYFSALIILPTNPPKEKNMLANELRIDAAEGSCAKGKGLCAAASVLVELSRIWKIKADWSGKNIS